MPPPCVRPANAAGRSHWGCLITRKFKRSSVPPCREVGITQDYRQMQTRARAETTSHFSQSMTLSLSILPLP